MSVWTGGAAGAEGAGGTESSRADMGTAGREEPQVSGWNVVGGGANSDKEHGSQLQVSLVWDTPISTDSAATGVGEVQLRARWTSLELRVGSGLEPEILELTPGNHEGNKLLGRVL